MVNGNNVDVDDDELHRGEDRVAKEIKLQKQT